jgi:hypothetical protein
VERRGIVTKTRLYTTEELAAMPTDEPWELWEGELRKVPGAGSKASGLAHWIDCLISLFGVPRDFGLVTGADGSFVFRRDLAVEVESPSDGRSDGQEKVRRYGDAGVPLVWWAYPDRRCVEVYRRGTLVATLGEGDAVDGEDMLPGFMLPVSEFFRGARRGR